MKFQKNHKLTITHGLSYTREYKMWVNIKQRCFNKKSKSYVNYGHRGILMQENWINNIEEFITYIKTIENYDKWISDNSYSIDRIKNDIGYVEGNLRFTDKSTQVYNTRLRVDNKYGIKGVSFDKRRNKYTLRVGIKHIGMFKSIEECEVARKNYIENEKY
jgi:hypothetical protein